VLADVYTRLSRDRDEQTSTTRQALDCTKLIEAKGWTVGETHEDVDFSAYRNVRRPAYNRLEAKIRSGEISAVVVWKIDRLARSLKEFLRFAELCEQHGVALVSVHEPFDTSSAIGRAIMQVLAVFAELESATIGIRVRSARDYAAANGKPKAGGRRPFGYERDMTQRDDEAREVRKAVDRVMRGESITSITKDWNVRGVMTVGGGTWSVRTVTRTLRAPHIAGIRMHRGDEVGDGDWEPIITRAEHAALCKPRGESRKQQRTYLLTGVLRCSKCGTRMAGRFAHNTRNYSCPPQPPYNGCGMQIKADPLEEFITDVVLEAASRPELRTVLSVKRNDRAAADVVEALRSVEEKMTNLSDAIAAGLPRAVALATTRQLVDEQQRLTRELEQMSSAGPLADVEAGGVPDAWNRRDLAWRSLLVAALIECVDVQPVGRGSRVPVEDRVTITTIE
jgi:site-specific DNA recombinase